MIPIYKPYLTRRERHYVDNAMLSGWISANGSYVKEFAEDFRKLVGAEYALPVSSGTTALQTAVQYIAKRRKNTKFLIPNLCYIAVANAIKTTPNASFIIGDIDRETMALSIEEIYRYKDNVDAIIYVHNYSNISDISKVAKICDESNIFLIEDACEALGCSYLGEGFYHPDCKGSLGVWGDIGVYSFFGNKTITTGEGGMLVTYDKYIYDNCYMISRQGVPEKTLPTHRYDHTMIGNNFRMTNLQAAVGKGQLENFDEIVCLKKEVTEYYDKHIDDKYKFMKNSYNDKNDYCNWLYYIKSDNRDKMMDYLLNNGIEVRPFFKTLHNTSFTGYLDDKDWVSREISEQGLNIPSYPELAEKELEYIVKAINNFGG